MILNMTRFLDVSNDDYTAILLQGSGTYAVEATFSTTVPRQDAKVLIIENGAYGQRMVKMCRTLNIPFDVVSFDETERVQVDRIAQQLETNRYTHVAIIHCETSSGILNPIGEIGQLVYQHGAQPGSTVFIVDSMSAFGAIPVDLRRDHISYLISSANKCIEGVPGFAFVIAKKDHLLTCQGLFFLCLVFRLRFDMKSSCFFLGQARSLALDLYDQYIYMQQSKQFRFTREFFLCCKIDFSLLFFLLLNQFQHQLTRFWRLNVRWMNWTQKEAYKVEQQGLFKISIEEKRFHCHSDIKIITNEFEILCEN